MPRIAEGTLASIERSAKAAANNLTISEIERAGWMCALTLITELRAAYTGDRDTYGAKLSYAAARELSEAYSDLEAEQASHRMTFKNIFDTPMSDKHHAAIERVRHALAHVVREALADFRAKKGNGNGSEEAGQVRRSKVG